MPVDEEKARKALAAFEELESTAKHTLTSSSLATARKTLKAAKDAGGIGL